MGKSAPSAPAIQAPPQITIQRSSDTAVAPTPTPPPLVPPPESNIAAVPDIDSQAILDDAKAKNTEAQRRKFTIADTILTSPLVGENEKQTLKTVLG